jgi:hypothetical protein
VLPLDEPAVFTEVQRITDWVTGSSPNTNCPRSFGYYSKLAYLRDAVARRPQLLTMTGKDPL